MIIKRIVINSFGGLSRKEIVLQEGVNVIVGPNESGKSTIYNAVKNTLFTPSNLTPARLKRQMGRFLPLGGGDTIEVAVCFKHQSKEYTLQRRWGASLSSSLTLPDGSVITHDDAIQEIINECIQVPEGTCKRVMMTHQAGLSSTVPDIRKDAEILESLGDILRRAVMEMDGVSVDAFRAKIEAEYQGLFGRWDIKAGYPEGGKGIENPWVKGAGTITQLFYKRERARKALEAAVEYEKQLDVLNKKISDHAGYMEKIKSYIENNRPFKEDAVKRQQIETELKGLYLQYEKLEKINKEWPVIESRVEEIRKRIPELEEKEKGLSSERKEAESYQKEKILLDQLSRVETKKKLVEEASERLKKIKILSEEDLKGIRTAFNKKNRLEASLSAGKLSFKFTPKSDTELEIKKGLEDKFRIRTKGGETLAFQTDGKLLAFHSDWELEVTSGKGEYNLILEEYDRAKGALEALFQKFRVKSLEEAEAANAAYKTELTRLEGARSNFEHELGEFTYEELKKKVNELQLKKPKRGLERIFSEAADIKAEIKALTRDLCGSEERLREYTDEFGNHHKLLEKLVEVLGARKEQQKALAALKPLPSGINNVNAFIAEYDEVEFRFKELKDEYTELIKDRIRLEGAAPDRSAEEMERDLAEAEERFDTELKNGLAIARIKHRMEALLKEMDGSTYKGLEKSVSQLIQQMTGGRYRDVVMKESIPGGFHRKDGVIMPYENLSTGTMDVLGIALRLGITKSFLQEKEGFIIMDDPLVDLDPDRQIRVAGAIKDFARNKQLILLTCHPSHARLLGGNQIELLPNQ
jgi:exonuclease SbcC